MNKTIVRIIAGVVTTAVVCGGIYGGLTVYRNTNTGPIKVYPVSELSMPSEYFTSEDSAYGSVSVDRMQNVYLSSTQTVKKVLVEEGQEVKKGDELLTYDTTLTQIQLDRAENEHAQLELSLKQAEEDLKKVDQLVPGSGGGYGDDYDDSGEDDADDETTEKTKKKKKYSAQSTPQRISGKGTKSNPYVYLWSTSDSLTNEELLLMFRPDGWTSTADDVETGVEGFSIGGLLRFTGLLPVDVMAEEVESGVEEAAEDPDEEEVTSDASSEEEAAEDPDEEDPADEDDTSSSADSGSSDSGDDESGSDGDVEEGVEDTGEEDEDSEETEEDDEEEDTEYVDVSGCPNEIWVLLEIHEYDNMKGDLLQQYGLHLIRDDQDVSVRLYSPGTTDTSDLEGLDDDDADDSDLIDVLDDEDVDDSDYGNEGSGDSDDDSSDIDLDAEYTAEEIAELKKQKTIEVRDLTLDVKMSQVNLREMKAELGDGTIRAKVDGVVKTVRDPEEAYQNGEAVVCVSGGGGYYVTVPISELDIPGLTKDQEVQVASFDSDGITYTGVIQSISAYPESNADVWSMGNPNVSYYPCKVYVDDTAELREYDYVEVKLNTSGKSSGFYIEAMFVASDSSGKYVYVEDEDGKLKRRSVRTGNQPDSSVIEILSGLKKGEYVAFPYGTDVVEGAKTEKASIDELYDY